MERIFYWLLALRLQQELRGCHKGHIAKFGKIFAVVRYNHIATSGFGALILQHVLEITHRSVQSCLQLHVVHWQNGNVTAQISKQSVHVNFPLENVCHLANVR